tara:strand:- start:7075 stop:7287 length:213 start_codon:yes stop_codon:yes gene_type:complete
MLTVTEHHLSLTADERRIKIIADAISDYVEKHGLEDDTTLNDFRFNLEVCYQESRDLDQDDWDFAEEDQL